MTITAITAYLSSISEATDENFEFFVTERLSKRYPNAKIRVCSRPGKTNIVANAGATRMEVIEAELQALCVHGWWQEFVAEQEAERGSTVWRAESTERGY